MKKNFTNANKGNIPIEKKLKAYSLAAASVLAVQPAAAAVVYTNIDPDTTFTATGDYLLDLNNDGTDDFNIQFTAGTDANSVRVLPTLGGEVLGSMGSGFFYPFAMNLNDAIDGNQQSWNGTVNGGYLTLAWLYTTGGAYGNWFGATDKYMGLRFKVGTNWHYGWVRMDIPSNVGQLIIKDYAFENVANTGIAAGDNGTIGFSIPVLPDAIALFANNRVLTVDLKDVDLNDARLTLRSINGQQVLSAGLIENVMEFNLEGLSRGLYLATIESREGILSRKLYIE